MAELFVKLCFISDSLHFLPPIKVPYDYIDAARPHCTRWVCEPAGETDPATWWLVSEHDRLRAHNLNRPGTIQQQSDVHEHASNWLVTSCLPHTVCLCQRCWSAAEVTVSWCVTSAYLQLIGHKPLIYIRSNEKRIPQIGCFRRNPFHVLLYMHIMHT